MPSSLPHTSPLNTEIERLPDGTPLVLVEVKGGTFMIGDDGDGSEKPDHPVQLRDFYMGQYPITNQQYSAFLNDYGSEKVLHGKYKDQVMISEFHWGCHRVDGLWKPAPNFDEHPVTAVSWYGANEFCHWLSTKTKKNFRLPSEAQWEYAARGGQNSQNFPYAGSHKLKEVGWFYLNSHSELKPVGWKKPNELGLFDMSGNVWEWCLDHYQRERSQIPKDGTPWLNTQKSSDPKASRVVRGGSWNYDVDYCRVSTRDWYYAVIRFNNIGFRVVRY